MDWTGVTNGPEFDIDNELNVYGSLTFSSNMTLLSSSSYDLNFKSTATGNTVTLLKMHGMVTFILRVLVENGHYRILYQFLTRGGL